MRGIAFGLVVVTVLPQAAYAYIDPGSGSAITTAIIGLFAAVGYTCRKYFYKISSLWGEAKNGTESKEDEKLAQSSTDSATAEEHKE
ncbi:MAG: putative membrane protein [Gammaproteobacteria bacterium]